MEVEPYDPIEHRSMLQHWCVQRELPATSLDILPTRGCIVRGIAAGFLYQTDSQVAFLEGIISNPESDDSDRDKALDVIFLALFDIAAALGFTFVWGFTCRPEVVTRAQRLGFQVDDTMTYTFGSKRVH